MTFHSNHSNPIAKGGEMKSTIEIEWNKQRSCILRQRSTARPQKYDPPAEVLRYAAKRAT